MARTRLTPERESELYAAVLDLLREVGYDALTMDAVAARTHSSKATLYRQWGSKPALVVTALRHNKPGTLGDVDTGSLRGDFHAVLSRSDDCQMEKDAALMRGLSHAVHNNPRPPPGPARTARRTGDDRSRHTAATGRGPGRGEPGQPALRYVPHMLIGAFATRQLVEDRPVDQAFLLDYVDSVILPALGV